MRTKKAPRQEIDADLKYGSRRIAKLINYVMKDGKKSVAQKQVYAALEQVADATKKEPIEIFEEVVKSVTPQMEVRSRRVGGAAYQVPMPVKSRRGFSLALRWMVEEANKRSKSEYHTFAERLAAEMLDALNHQGGAIARKEASHRMAEANKAFAHFRW